MVESIGWFVYVKNIVGDLL